MVKTIVWNRRASNSFDSIIEYLQQKWGDRVTKNFVIRTFQILDFLAEHPEMGSIENYEKQIRGLLSRNTIRCFIELKIKELFY